MKTKHQIFKERREYIAKLEAHEPTTPINERLILEALIDIRDVLIKQFDPDKAIELIDFELDN